MNRTIISQDNSETIEAITDEFRFTIKQEFMGYLPDEINRYKVIILNRAGARQLKPILDKWLGGRG